LHLDVILLVALAALSVWTEVDKLRKPRLPEPEAEDAAALPGSQ